MVSVQQSDNLIHELTALFQYVRRVREEIAAISRGADGNGRFETMGEQLDAIVEATEKATHTIMEAAERNQEIVVRLKEGITDPGQVALLDQITENGNTVFEACSFQDITGQRVSKVVKSISYLEQRVDALADTWGKHALEEVDVQPEAPSGDEEMLSGPALKGEGITQDEIDKLFD